MPVPHLSVIIPAYNESTRITAALESTSAYLSQQSYAWEVVVVDDGSADGTANIAADWMAGREGFRVERIAHGGKGAAVRHGMLAAKGELRFMCDADLAMPIEGLADFLERMRQGYDVAIGSRQVAGANYCGESRLRRFLGRMFNTAIQLIVVGGFQDTQCGFKCFTAASADELFALQRTNGWGFDAELLYIARKRGMKVIEMPIDWQHDEASKLSPTKAAVTMLMDALAIRWRAMRGMYAARR